MSNPSCCKAAEVIENTAMGKTFWVCRGCKQEVPTPSSKENAGEGTLDDFMRWTTTTLPNTFVSGVWGLLPLPGITKRTLHHVPQVAHSNGAHHAIQRVKTSYQGSYPFSKYVCVACGITGADAGQVAATPCRSLVQPPPGDVGCIHTSLHSKACSSCYCDHTFCPHSPETKECTSCGLAQRY